ncbi:MAG TPA: ABC transporter permease subunit [Rhizobiales bacterium]|nr:ABC transporter permease subunit [Hyphomicrobiales bacterium]
MDFELIVRSLPALMDGAGMTLLLTAISAPLGLAVALPLAVARLSHRAWLRRPAHVFIYVFRGTPLLIQLFLVYFGLGQFHDTLEAWGLWWFFRDELYCALFVLILNTGAYSAEIFRGAIAGVPAGHIEAAMAAGMGWFTRLRRIILPSAFRIAWPAYTNEVVFLMQATSLVSLLTVTELFRSAKIIAVRTFDIYSMYITAGLIYLAISYGIILTFGMVEKHLMRHTRQPVDKLSLHRRAFAMLSR